MLFCRLLRRGKMWGLLFAATPSACFGNQLLNPPIKLFELLEHGRLAGVELVEKRVTRCFARHAADSADGGRSCFARNTIDRPFRCVQAAGEASGCLKLANFAACQSA